MIDADGYRSNVGIIICNKNGQVLWAKRFGQHSWQFPQGGIKEGETPEAAMYRELHEEVGLKPEHVKVVAASRQWLRYKLPKRLVRWESPVPVCIGQKQRWFLLQLIAEEEQIEFESCAHPEFDDWRWVTYWYPVRQVVSFKRDVYRRALAEFCQAAFTLMNNKDKKRSKRPRRSSSPKR
jgi:putative (di)nucleoside polyphosphate hydrolase